MALLRSPTSSRWECTAVALILALGLILSVPHIDDTLRKPPSRSLEVSQADGRRTDTSAPQPSMAQRNVPTNLSQAPGTVRPKIDRSPKPVAGTRVDCAVPAVTETPIASTAGVAHVAWTPDELVQCLQNGIGQSGAGGIDVVGLGDSHSRKAFESLSDRLPESKRAFIQRRVIPKRKHGDLVGIGGAVPIPADPKPREGEFRVYNTFGARVGRTAIMEPEFPWRGKVSRAQRQSHVLITRGAWDLQRLNSSLRTIHDDIISALTTVAAWKDVASITFRTVHPVAGEVPKLRGRCQRRELATVVRAVGACAVARYMRGDKARKPGRKVTVLDLWDFGLRAGRGGYSDFQHFGGSTNAASADLFLRMGVCPGQPHPVLNASNDNGGVWWSSDAAAIEQRFKCDLAFPLTAKPTDDITAGPVMIGEWDVKYGTAQDVGCMCDIPNLGDNDRCAILLGTRIPYADFLSSALVYRTICDALQRPASERWRVALSSEHLDSLRLSDRQPAPPWFAALISSVCLAPNRGEVAYAKAFAVNPSCDPRSPGGGGDLTKEQMNLLRRLRDVRDTLAPPPAADRQLRSVNASTSVLSCSEAPLWDTVLRVVCQPIWLGEQSIKLASLVPADASVQRWLAIASSKLASKRSL